jgi:hypothetical protein
MTFVERASRRLREVLDVARADQRPFVGSWPAMEAAA